MSKEEKFYCSRCNEELNGISAYISDIDHKIICNKCFQKEQPKELAKQLVELKAENENLVKYKKWFDEFLVNYEINLDTVPEYSENPIIEYCKQVEDFRCADNHEQKMLEQQLKEKDDQIEALKAETVSIEKFDSMMEEYEDRLKEKDEEIEKQNRRINLLVKYKDDQKERVKKYHNQLKENSNQVCEKIRDLAINQFEFIICDECYNTIDKDVYISSVDLNKILHKIEDGEE